MQLNILALVASIALLHGIVAVPMPAPQDLDKRAARLRLPRVSSNTAKKLRDGWNTLNDAYNVYDIASGIKEAVNPPDSSGDNNKLPPAEVEQVAPEAQKLTPSNNDVPTKVVKGVTSRASALPRAGLRKATSGVSNRVLRPGVRHPNPMGVANNAMELFNTARRLRID